MSYGRSWTTKGNQQWVWLAIDAETREMVGVHVGDRSETGAKALWQSLPPVYQQCAVCYTDFWAAYATVLPSRPVRKTLSFSKKPDNHIGAIWYFIHHYNPSLPVYTTIVDVEFRTVFPLESG